MKPEARTDDVLVEKVGDELVVYDRARHEAHRLNAPAAVVWQHCDGRRTEEELARVLGDTLGGPADGDVVRFALGELDRAKLLVPGAVAIDAISRREVLTRLRKAAYLLPVVASMVAPTPLAAASDSAGTPTSPSASPTATPAPSPTSAPPTSPTPSPTAAPTPSPSPTAAPTPSPSPTAAPTPTTDFSGTYNCTFTRTAQSGNCNFQSSFNGQIVLTDNRSGGVTIRLIEQLTRNYSGSINSSGQFNCTGNNSFGGCTQTNGSCNGTISGNNITCDESLPLSSCCSGTVTYHGTGSK